MLTRDPDFVLSATLLSQMKHVERWPHLLHDCRTAQILHHEEVLHPVM
jgi:hypothetical protein